MEEAGGRLGARPGGGEAGHVGVWLTGAAGLWEGGGDGERGLSGAAHGRRCAPRGLAEPGALRRG